MGNGSVAELCAGCGVALGNGLDSEDNSPAVTGIAASTDGGSIIPNPAKGRAEQID